ncbi:MAG: S-layer homology domain-containing protein, partial [Peptococcaceae bacterium]
MKKKLLASLLAIAMMVSMVTPAMAAEAVPQDDAMAMVSNEAVTAAEGPDAVTSWYDESKNEFTIESAEELAGLAKLVAEGKTFANKTVTLGKDIDLSVYTNWQPIGSSSKRFNGIFNGGGHTIKNLTAIYPEKHDIGLFGYTDNGEIKNFILENAVVKGNQDVGAVAGTPHTSKYINITVKGLIQVDGISYVGGALGKNAYANITNVDVLGELGSYVKADSGIYRTYVGGLVGFMGEGGHKVSDCDVKIDVTGSTCDIGGILGILHYGNTLENCTYEGNLKMDDPNETELGALVGVTMNSNQNVTTTMKNCKATVHSAILAGKDVTDSLLPHGGFYYPTVLGSDTVFLEGTVNGKPFHIENKPVKVGDTYYTTLADAIAQNNSGTITLMANITENVTIPQGKNLTLDLNGKTLASGKQDKHTVYVNGGTLTVIDSSVGQPVVGEDHKTVNYSGSGIIKTTDTTSKVDTGGYAHPIDVDNGGTLNLQGGTLYTEDSDGIFVSENSTINMTGGYVNAKEYGIGVMGQGATLNLYDGVVKARNNAAVAGNGNGKDGTTIIMSGGTLIGEMSNEAVEKGYIACGIYHPQEGTLTVNGGNIYVHNGAGILTRGGAATVNNVNIVTTGKVEGKIGDSEIKVPPSAVVVDEKADYPAASLNTDIKGGEFVSAEGVSNVTLVGQTNDKLTVSGGNFSAPVPQENLDPKLNTEVKAPNKNPDAPYSYFEKQEEALDYAKDDKDATIQPTEQVSEKVTVTFDVAGGQGAPASMTVAKGDKMPPIVPTREGYTFIGWKDVNGNVYQAGKEVTVTEDITFTAVWEANASTGGGTVVKRYDVTLADTDNGSITATHKRASKNSTVTITATPDEGYVVDAVTVTEKDGDKVNVTKKDDNKYTFKMPASDVTVKATFKAEQTEPEQPTGLPFTDVAKDAWYFPAVEYVFNNGLMNGTTATTFAPNVNLNRAMMAAVLYNMEGGPACDKSGLFSDVADGKWYTDAVNWAASNNIVSGMPDGTYAPDQALTREQMASILYRYAEYKGIDVSARA